MKSEARRPLVFIAAHDVSCAECGEELGRGRWFLATPERRPVCMSCADMDHLVFLPSGDAALTRRATKLSRLHAVVLKWSKARRRNERQGCLVEEEALAQAEKECLADADARQRRRERQAERREEIDQIYVQEFAERIREFFPGLPPQRANAIAEHACRKYSGRVGRSAAAKEFDEQAITLAVVAHARHTETNYDKLLCEGQDRANARDAVRGQVERALDAWRQSTG